MIVYKRDKNLIWKLDHIHFLYPPDDFTGSFANARMQERHEAMQQEKVKELVDHLEKHTDPLEAMLGLHPLDHLQFLQNNLEQFRQAQRLEKAVLSLYFRKNTPFAAAGDYEVWKSLFAGCDRERLSAEGKPFPYERVTAYRGSVTDNPKGLSWTVSREEAAWFLSRWQDKSLGGGTVFALDITRQDILVYIEDGKKREVILKPEIAEAAQPRVIEQL